MKKCSARMGLWGLVILVGIGIAAYPAVEQTLQRHRQQDLISLYLQGKMPPEEMLQGKCMLGVLWIPKVQCLLPIWEGTDEAALRMGAGHLEGSSPLTAEEGTHTVLCAHSGLPQLYAFDRIDSLRPGDTFYIIRQDGVLVYTVTNQSTVLPEEVHLLLQPSQFANQVTLLTCTPYGINTHRLLVQAELSRSLGGPVPSEKGKGFEDEKKNTGMDEPDPVGCGGSRLPRRPCGRRRAKDPALSFGYRAALCD